MSKLKILTERCKSCGYCINNCPKKALSFSNKINSKGYKYVEAEESKCIQCGICFNMCPDWAIEVGVE